MDLNSVWFLGVCLAAEVYQNGASDGHLGAESSNLGAEDDNILKKSEEQPETEKDNLLELQQIWLKHSRSHISTDFTGSNTSARNSYYNSTPYVVPEMQNYS